jgi:thymidylate kinase
MQFLIDLMHQVAQPAPRRAPAIYDKVVFLKTDPTVGLKRAKAAKQEFAAGDAMEARGNAFITHSSNIMEDMLDAFPHTVINIDGYTIEDTFAEILRSLELGD